MLIKLVDSGTLGNCPAAVVMGTPPTYEINIDRWARLKPSERRFILAHEMGHHALQTNSETTADRYALHLTAGTTPQSLKSAMRALNSMQAIPYNRLQTLFNECKTIDQAMKQKLFTTKNYSYADGGASLNDTTNDTQADALQQLDSASVVINNLVDRRRAGLRINGYFFSIESLVGMATLVCAVIIACKICNQ